MAGKIFINYRREISGAAAGRLSDRLVEHFDLDLFMDVDGIEPGVDFVKALDEQVARCSAFIAVIGPGWADLTNAEGQRRLDQPDDYVRIEIESALKRDIRVIPVLVDGAGMPKAELLPDSLKPLSRRNAVTLSHQRFSAEVDELARALQRALGLNPKPTTTPYAFAAIETPIHSAAIETPTQSWIDYLFSFEGRISRKSFWLSTLGLFVFALLVMGGLAAVLGKAGWDAEKQAPSETLARIYNIAVLPLYWPLFALYLKRLHDFGQGRGGLWTMLIITFLMSGAQFAGFDSAANVLTLIAVSIVAMVGCIKGTLGPNQYGPDPLANIARKSAS